MSNSLIQDLSIGIFCTTILPKYRDQVIVCKETWGKCPLSEARVQHDRANVLFFGGHHQDPTVKLISLPGTGEDYASATVKQYKMLYYMTKYAKARFYFVGGSDNYVLVDRLLALTQEYDDQDYFIGDDSLSFKMDNKTISYHSGGGGFLISHNLLVKLLDKLHLPEDYYNSENLWFVLEWNNLCALNNVTYLLPACDASCSYWIKKYFPETIIVEDLRFTICSHMNLFHSDTRYEETRTIDWKNMVTCHYMEKGACHHLTNYLTRTSVDPDILNKWVFVSKYKGVEDSFIYQLPLILYYGVEEGPYHLLEKYPHLLIVRASEVEDPVKLITLALDERYGESEQEYYAFIDNDIERYCHDDLGMIYEIMETREEELKVCCTSYQSEPVISNMFFTSSRSKLFELASSDLFLSLEANKMSETILTMESNKRYYGSIHSLLANYNHQNINGPHVVDQIIVPALINKDYNFAKQVCKKFAEDDEYVVLPNDYIAKLKEINEALSTRVG
jgi:hypothetical protein